MLTKIRAWIERYQLLNYGDKVLVACSGGPDSLALVRIMHTLAGEYGVELAVAHVNHMLRGSESDADEAFVREFCAAAGLPVYLTKIDVPRFIDVSGRSTEDAARILRYSYLRKVAAALGGAKIATGHHRDDQAETVLLNLFRGTGMTGLRGIKPNNGGIIRPLLDISRSEIEIYCREQGLNPRLDSTNLKTDYLRNYVRLELMPLLKNKLNVNLTDALFRTASLVGDAQDFIEKSVKAAWPMVARCEEDKIELNCGELMKLHLALAREIIRAAIEKKRGTLKGITFSHVENLLELAANGETGKVVELPGNLIARKEYWSIILEMPKLAKETTGIRPPGVEIMIPGTTYIPELEIEITAELLKSMPEKNLGGAVFDWRKLTPPLYVRTRQDGDRFWPSGMSGSKKLKKYFIDAKVPRAERDRIPVLCDSKGIIWLAGCRQAQRGIPDHDTRDFLYLTIKRQGS
ncbi:MAG: tRNA(Ile)-lysidine synthase [Firmicutes bacterium]|nr:tRNA(Ile)-lysidine synthase [Bacillota bacterium]